MKQFECFWGDGYRGEENRSILAYNNLDFFTFERGYSEDDINEVEGLGLGDYAQFQECGDHWVRRIA